MVPMGQTLFGSLNPVRTGGRCRSALLLPNSIPKGIRGKGRYSSSGSLQSPRRVVVWYFHLLNYPASYSAPIYRFADFTLAGTPAVMPRFRTRSVRPAREAGTGR